MNCHSAQQHSGSSLKTTNWQPQKLPGSCHFPFIEHCERMMRPAGRAPHGRTFYRLWQLAGGRRPPLAFRLGVRGKRGLVHLEHFTCYTLNMSATCKLLQKWSYPLKIKYITFHFWLPEVAISLAIMPIVWLPQSGVLKIRGPKFTSWILVSGQCFNMLKPEDQDDRLAGNQQLQKQVSDSRLCITFVLLGILPFNCQSTYFKFSETVLPLL